MELLFQFHEYYSSIARLEFSKRPTVPSRQFYDRTPIKVCIFFPFDAFQCVREKSHFFIRPFFIKWLVLCFSGIVLSIPDDRLSRRSYNAAESDFNRKFMSNNDQRSWIQGPSFDAKVPQNVTAIQGQTAELVCRVFKLGNKTVCFLLRTTKRKHRAQKDAFSDIKKILVCVCVCLLYDDTKEGTNTFFYICSSFLF